MLFFGGVPLLYGDLVGSLDLKLLGCNSSDVRLDPPKAINLLQRFKQRPSRFRAIDSNIPSGAQGQRGNFGRGGPESCELTSSEQRLLRGGYYLVLQGL